MSNNPPTLTVGEARTLRATWTADGDLVDPDTVVLTVRDPDDNITTPAVTNPSVGVYEVLHTFDEVGNWYWEWTGTADDGTRICRGAACVVPSWMAVGASS